ncbi:MAG: hypothetical protein ACJ8AJ_08955 [Gemmatimonadaceae bacterium]
MRTAAALFFVAIVGFIIRQNTGNAVAGVRGSSLSVELQSTHYRANGLSTATPSHKSLRSKHESQDCPSKFGVVSIRAVMM